MKLLNNLGCAGLITSTLTFVGCGGGDFPVAPVTGVILCEGEPVPGALVYFEPQQKGIKALVGKTGLGMVDDQGKFTVRTYGSDDGAVVGVHNVKVERGDGPGCNCAMNADKTVTVVEVKSDSENNFTIELPRKTRMDKKAERVEAEEDEEDEEDN